jgi:O-acetyl-ADP-ribose deacetylase (regulator of RNase III)
MGSYKEINGDIIELHKEHRLFDYIAHGANCMSIMGAGVALSIRQNFPSAYYIDKYSSLHPYEKLGSFTGSFEDKVFNLYTQYQPGPNLDYEALTLALRKLNRLFQGVSFGIPQIGCGIGGGDWKKVKKIIQRELCDLDVTVVIYKKQE